MEQSTQFSANLLMKLLNRIHSRCFINCLCDTLHVGIVDCIQVLALVSVSRAEHNYIYAGSKTHVLVLRCVRKSVCKRGYLACLMLDLDPGPCRKTCRSITVRYLKTVSNVTSHLSQEMIPISRCFQGN